MDVTGATENSGKKIDSLRFGLQLMPFLTDMYSQSFICGGITEKQQGEQT